MFSKTFFVRLKHASDITILYGDEILNSLKVPDFKGSGFDPVTFKPEIIKTLTDYDAHRDDYLVWRDNIKKNIKPTLGHYSMVDIQSLFESVHIVTTECSGLGKEAGIKNLVELNKNIKNYEHPRWFDAADQETYKKASAGAAVCEVFIVVGYNIMDEMASKLPFIAKGNGCYMVEVSKTETEFTRHCNESIREDVNDFLPKLAILMKKVYK
jgi:NAD-dependent SIR2 family protein deacetylase